MMATPKDIATQQEVAEAKAAAAAAATAARLAAEQQARDEAIARQNAIRQQEAAGTTAAKTVPVSPEELERQRESGTFQGRQVIPPVADTQGDGKPKTDQGDGRPAQPGKAGYGMARLG